MSDEKDKSDKSAECARKARRDKTVERFKPFFFVIITLLAWWAIASAGYVVGSCIPGGIPCELKVLTGGIGTRAEAAGQGTPSSDGQAPGTETEEASTTWRDYIPEKRDWVVMVSLLTALWVAKVMIYPYDDLSKPAK